MLRKPLQTFLWASVVGLLCVPTAAEISNTCFEVRGPNPCCAWNPSGNCSWDDADDTTCNDPGAKLGAYSTACADYLRTCTQTSWMRDTATDFRDFIEQKTAQAPEGFLPSGTSLQEAYQKADELVAGPWASFDTRDGKATGIGFIEGTYLGIYNCLSPFELAGNGTGCEVFSLLGDNKYAATVRHHPGNNGDVQFLCDLSLPVLSRDERCAFNVLRQDQDSFTYLLTLEHPFDPLQRGWFNTARTDPQHGAQPIFLAPYENYQTDHPVFGFTQGVFLNGEFRAAATVLQYIADNPAYQTFNPACMP